MKDAEVTATVVDIRKPSKSGLKDSGHDKL